MIGGYKESDYASLVRPTRCAFSRNGMVMCRRLYGGESMRRREFITLLGGAAAMGPRAARAQQSERMRRIGVFMFLAADDPESKAYIAAFAQHLQELGWTLGHNVQIDYR